MNSRSGADRGFGKGNKHKKTRKASRIVTLDWSPRMASTCASFVQPFVSLHSCSKTRPVSPEEHGPGRCRSTLKPDSMADGHAARPPARFLGTARIPTKADPRLQRRKKSRRVVLEKKPAGVRRQPIEPGDPSRGHLWRKDGGYFNLIYRRVLSRTRNRATSNASGYVASSRFSVLSQIFLGSPLTQPQSV